eukprot:3784399-Alexandrium_andersonii.AAC.1
MPLNNLRLVLRLVLPGWPNANPTPVQPDHHGHGVPLVTVRPRAWRRVMTLMLRQPSGHALGDRSWAWNATASSHT